MRWSAIYGNIAGDIMGKLEPIYGGIADGDIEEDDLLGSEFNQWWGREWQRIKKDFDVWYAESIQGRKEADALGSEHQELAALHAAYDEKIDSLLSNLTTAQLDELKRIYTAGGTISMPDPREGNYKIREELFREIQKKFETELTDQLAQALQVLIDQIAQKTQALLWETEEVRKTLLHSMLMKVLNRRAFGMVFKCCFYVLAVLPLKHLLLNPCKPVNVC